MCKTIKEFLNRLDIKEIRKHDMGKLMAEDFFRDPCRHITINDDLFLAPADGVVLYAHPEVKPDQDLEIKGKNFTLKDMLAYPEYAENSLVVGIFMTSLDVHINRIPFSAYFIDRFETNFIYTHNISMILVENELLFEFGYDKKSLGYLTSNEKKVSVFYAPTIKSRYYIVQVGDKDIDVVLNWGHGRHLHQGIRFGAIRYGSQVDLVIPLKKGNKYEVLVKPLDHVEAGIDPIVRVVSHDKSRMES